LTDHFNKLTNPEIERLSCLMEECGEVIQVIGKIFRHGFEHKHVKYGDRTNRENLAMEIGDVQIAIERILSNGDINETTISWSRTTKLSKIDKSLRYNKTKP
jgi:NTP pyrophosphatase (non-canonical NTP hydrolase)